MHKCLQGNQGNQVIDARPHSVSGAVLCKIARLEWPTGPGKTVLEACEFKAYDYPISDQQATISRGMSNPE